MEGQKTTQIMRFYAKILALILLSAGLFVALFSYDAFDPSPFNLRTVENAQNALGIAGAMVSGALREAFGWGAWMLPLLVLHLLLPAALRLNLVSWAVRATLLLSATSGLIFCLWVNSPTIVEKSGWVGWALTQWAASGEAFSVGKHPGNAQTQANLLTLVVCTLVFLRNLYRFACVHFWRAQALRFVYFKSSDVVAYLGFVSQKCAPPPRIGLHRKPVKARAGQKSMGASTVVRTKHGTPVNPDANTAIEARISPLARPKTLEPPNASPIDATGALRRPEPAKGPPIPKNKPPKTSEPPNASSIDATGALRRPESAEGAPIPTLPTKPIQKHRTNAPSTPQPNPIQPHQPPKSGGLAEYDWAQRAAKLTADEM